jgi:hypothetical protein
LFAAYELGEDRLYGHIKPRKTRARFLEFCWYLGSLYPQSTRIAVICDNFSPHLSTAKDAPGRDLGRREQRRDRIHADHLVLVKPHRGAIHGSALLHA